jgi:hypothetical protein
MAENNEQQFESDFNTCLPTDECVRRAADAARLASIIRFGMALTQSHTWHPSDKFLSIYVRKEDSDQTHAGIAEHIEECESCRKRVRELEGRALSEDGNERNDATPPSNGGWWKRLKRGPWRSRRATHTSKERSLKS